jgi:hypothetical protein
MWVTARKNATDHFGVVKGRAGKGKAMNVKLRFVSADCAYVAVRKFLQITGGYKCIKAVFYNARHSSHS